MRLNAPRGLNDPVTCSSSSFRIERGLDAEGARPATSSTGVRRTCGAMRSNAASIWCGTGSTRYPSSRCCHSGSAPGSVHRSPLRPRDARIACEAPRDRGSQSSRNRSWYQARAQRPRGGGGPASPPAPRPPARTRSRTCPSDRKALIVRQVKTMSSHHLRCRHQEVHEGVGGDLPHPHGSPASITSLAVGARRCRSTASSTPSAAGIAP